jgi:hypothetical protein
MGIDDLDVPPDFPLVPGAVPKRSPELDGRNT